jgi:hypothetical protein
MEYAFNSAWNATSLSGLNGIGVPLGPGTWAGTPFWPSGPDRTAATAPSTVLRSAAGTCWGEA